MSYYCHECAQRREVVYHPLACAVCGSEIIDSIPIVNEESSEEEELQEFFSEIDMYYNALAREQAQDDANFPSFEDEEEEGSEEALEERCLFEQLASMYNHPVARNFTSSSTHPFIASSSGSDTPTVLRELAERLHRNEAEEAEEEADDTEDDGDIISYDVRFEQRAMNENNELEPPHADRTWETPIAPEPETESLFHLPFARFGRLLDAMYSYRSDDESDEGDGEYHRRSFLDNLADILSDYTSEARQQQSVTTPSATVDVIVKSLQKSCLDSSDPLVHDECIICQEVYGTSIEIFHLPCQHKYHGVCITKWFSVNTSCPICRHPADKEQQQNQAMQQGQQQQQSGRPQNTTPPSITLDGFSSPTSSAPSLPSTSSSFVSATHEVERFDWSAMRIVPGHAPSLTDSDQSEDVVLDVWQNSDTEPSREQNEQEEHDTDSDDDIVRSFERSISSVLSPRVLNTILGGDSDSRSQGTRDVYPPLNPMDFYMTDRYRTPSPRIRWDISSVHDDDDDDDTMLMDWVHNSSMDEVD
ncbi:uncharacterized protein ATC70_011898 [Mucor velutinosus]|uniref:RING-type domain-containing protein n=1 Tax=Mucor velutinosus TaxID=708070 RepID=A0AAN7HQJ7_9FUNG|nr:hypothetical protein ATC70_011898 [Mucor velutinosus]